ncbi:hypothetical protein BpHYR1_015245 [Brachionus plicatilis]|uniref:Uncharacterized protein n=1 Tax=Brachionus plicatilis TaxID=10195 RepID=A0A3M7Q544_BRAPC|nr:hypothetical protein BpHYR1_015245 [Brachionus plicatilis]
MRLIHNSNSDFLYQNSPAQTCLDQRLGYPSGSISATSVDFSVVFARKSSTTMSTPATISVHNDLSTSQTGITLRTTNDKSPNRV